MPPAISHFRPIRSNRPPVTARLAVATTLWVTLPALLGLSLAMRSEVK